MGAVKSDIHAKGREYSQTYALNSTDGVKTLLRDRNRIAERRYRGDYDASTILIDLHSAIESASLTDRQTEVLTLISRLDLTQTEAAKALSITQQAVAQVYDAAVEKLRAVYERWNYGAIDVQFDVAVSSAEVGA